MTRSRALFIYLVSSHPGPRQTAGGLWLAHGARPPFPPIYLCTLGLKKYIAWQDAKLSKHNPGRGDEFVRLQKQKLPFATRMPVAKGNCVVDSGVT